MASREGSRALLKPHVTKSLPRCDLGLLTEGRDSHGLARISKNEPERYQHFSLEPEIGTRQGHLQWSRKAWCSLALVCRKLRVAGRNRESVPMKLPAFSVLFPERLATFPDILTTKHPAWATWMDLVPGTSSCWTGAGNFFYKGLIANICVSKVTIIRFAAFQRWQQLR